jgi:hypothetical protein
MYLALGVKMSLAFVKWIAPNFGLCCSGMPPKLCKNNGICKGLGQGNGAATLLARYGENLSQIILFGSQARGNARADSDIDVLIVLEDKT